MKNKAVKKLFSLFAAAVMLFAMIPGVAAENEPIPIKVLILPKFESEELSGDFPGEAQYFYEAWCEGGEEYEIAGGHEGRKLYVKDGVALYVTGAGKVNAALSTTAVLRDSRFDFSNAFVLSVGCAGSAKEYGTMGDVYVISATVDGELGHRVDSRELTNPEQLTTWYYDELYAADGCRVLNQELVAQVYDLVKNVVPETTEHTRAYMAAAFDGADWAVRDPQVLLGTSVTTDAYWKGETDHQNALLAVETYNCPDPYAVTEMEDNAVAVALDRLGILDRLIILRCSVNTDVFMNGSTPESLWNPEADNSIDTENGVESADIFATAMKNNFTVGNIIIEAILDGTISADSGRIG